MKALFLCLSLLLSIHFLNAQDFKKVDQHAKNTPSGAEKSIETLAAYLNKAGTSETEKVRAYYVWLTDNIAYDTKTFFSNNPKPKTSATDALNRRKAICQGYAELFKALCDNSNIECFIITGYSKGYGYTPNKKFDNSDHAWNAVKTDGEWKLIDATWGAGYLNDKKKYEQRFTEKYFSPNPAKMVLDHLPVDPMWQLLSCPISMSDYTLKNEEITKLTENKADCFSYKDTIATYQKLSHIEQQVNSAERALRFNPKNYAVAGFAYLELGFELSQTLAVLYDEQKYKEALKLNQEILAYNQKAYTYLKKSSSPQAKNAADICKQNIDKMKENIRSLEKFMD